MGRPSKLTEEAEDRFLRAVSAGVHPEVAARHAGFSPASMYRYLRGSTPELAEFRGKFLQAQANLEIRLAGTLLQAAMTEPRWALAVLERRFPDRWRINAAGPEPAEADQRSGPAPETPEVIDQAMLDELEPKLLQAGLAVTGHAGDGGPDMAAFVDNGATEGDRMQPEPLPASAP
jgi:hypothetical protein